MSEKISSTGLLRLPLFSILLLAVAGSFPAGSPGLAASEDLANHPAYSKYKFGRESHVIDVATQPLAVSVGVIAEVMKHDRILRRALGNMGMEIRFHPFLKGADLNYFFKRGDVELAMAGDLPTITLASTHDIVIAGLAKQGASSVVTREMILLQELKGKRIGYPEGSTAHYGLLIALASVGLKESDVTLVPLENMELPDALAMREIDAFSAFEPTPTVALARHEGFVVIQRFLNSSYFYLSRSFVERHPAAAHHVVASFVRALKWMKKETRNLARAAGWIREAGKDLQGDSPGPSIEEIAAITSRDTLRVISDPYVPRNDFTRNGPMRKAFEFLKGQGKIPATVPWGKIRNSMDQEMMKKVLSNPGTYGLNRFDYRDPGE